LLALNTGSPRYLLFWYLCGFDDLALLKGICLIDGPLIFSFSKEQRDSKMTFISWSDTRLQLSQYVRKMLRKIFEEKNENKPFTATARFLLFFYRDRFLQKATITRFKNRPRSWDTTMKKCFSQVIELNNHHKLYLLFYNNF
jgi:hypothetical protein